MRGLLVKNLRSLSQLALALTVLHPDTSVFAQAAPSELPAPTDAEREAAFPDLSDMDLREMMMEDPFNTLVLFDRLEAQEADGSDILDWDLDAWAGRDVDKLWVRSEGERRGGETEHAEVELLWGRVFGRWWDVVMGIRQDFEPGPRRSWAAFGVRGLAPYWFELDATAYLTEGGQAAARLEAEYDLLITQRLILQPLIEVTWYMEDDAEREIGSGISSAEIGLRLRYEIRREIAPYIGVLRSRSFGDTAEAARASGREANETRFVVGARFWF